MAELVVEPWTNEFGQTVNPGDEVIFVGSSWKQTKIRKGIFGGVHYALRYRSRKVIDANGDFVSEVNRWGQTVLKTESYSSREVVSVRVEKVNRGRKWAYVDDPATGKKVYKQTLEEVYGVSTLPRKRVYRLDTPMTNIIGQRF